MQKSIFKNLNEFFKLFTNTGAIIILDDINNTKISYSKLEVLLDDLKTEGNKLLLEEIFKLKNIYSSIINDEDMIHRISYTLHNKSRIMLIKTKKMNNFQLLHFQNSIKKCFRR